jgi:hypothetical protein
MKKSFIISVILLSVFISSCGPGKNEPDPANFAKVTKGVMPISESTKYQIIEIDSCEYIFGWDNMAYNGGYFLSHKGNCKYCAIRNKK